MITLTGTVKVDIVDSAKCINGRRGIYSGIEYPDVVGIDLDGNGADRLKYHLLPLIGENVRITVEILKEG